ncbi:hypothetical protein K492DRAFT_39019 [Lichtheimia hyalospora FSU 10163]|nr:hypothetical protein K492DRAFT_39019 [Lichtheimia hyalospora FSU 10163]
MAICPQCQSTDISLKSGRKGECRNCKERFTIHDRQRERNNHSQSQKEGKRSTYMVNEYDQDASFTPNKRSRYEDDNDIHPARNDTRMNRLAIQRGIPSSSSTLHYGSSTDKPALFSLSSKRNRNNTNTNTNNSQRVNQINDDEHSLDKEDDLLERVKREELESIDFEDDATQDTEMLLEHFNTRFAKPVSKRNMYQTTSGSIDFGQDDDDTIDDDVLNLGINDNTMSSSDRTLRDTSLNTRKGSSTIVDEDEDLYTWHMPLKKRSTRGMKHQTHSLQQSQQHDDSESESDFQPEGVDDDDDDDLFDTDEEEIPQRRQFSSRFPHNHSPAFKRPLYNGTTELDNIEYASAATYSSRQRKKKAHAQPKPIAPGTVSVDVINKAKQGKSKR